MYFQFFILSNTFSFLIQRLLIWNNKVFQFDIELQHALYSLSILYLVQFSLIYIIVAIYTGFYLCANYSHLIFLLKVTRIIDTHGLNKKEIDEIKPHENYFLLKRRSAVSCSRWNLKSVYTWLSFLYNFFLFSKLFLCIYCVVHKLSIKLL